MGMEKEKNVEDKNINSLSDLWKKHPVISILIILFLAGAVSSISNEVVEISNDTSAQKTPVAEEVASVEQKDIKVTFQTVKKVDDKYRYFFDIRNNEEESVEAEVKIELLRENDAVSGRNTFAPNHPLESGFGDSVYLDARSGPVPDFDPEYAVVGFRYEVVTDDQTVSYGQEDF
jgi:hypothetical protein